MSEWTHIAPRRALGQHFLHDERVLRRITELATPQPGSGLLEIGPGTGNLTEHLLAHQCPLIAIERDRRLPAVLAARFDDRVEVVRADATRLDYAPFLAAERLGPEPVVVGNLPYNVGTEILFRVLESTVPAARMVFMLQREVAQRLVAAPSTSAYGLLTVKVAMRADVQLVMRIRPGAFAPPPKVESAVVVVQPLSRLRFDVPSYEGLCALLDAGFGLRRKTLVNALRNRLKIPAEAVRDALCAQGLDPRSRAETLGLQQWAALTVHLHPYLSDADRARPGRSKGNKPVARQRS